MSGGFFAQSTRIWRWSMEGRLGKGEDQPQNVVDDTNGQIGSHII